MAKVKCIECFPLRADKIEEPGPEIDFCENRAPKFCTPPLFPRLLGTETSEPPREEKRPRNSVRRLYSLDISAPNTENPKFCTPPLYMRRIWVQNKTPKKTVRRLYSLDFSGFAPARRSRTDVAPDPEIKSLVATQRNRRTCTAETEP